MRISKGERHDRAAVALRIWQEEIGSTPVQSSIARQAGVPLPRGTLTFMKNEGYINKTGDKYTITHRGINLGSNYANHGRYITTFMIGRV